MVTIDAFQPSDLATLIRFVEAMQEHERVDVPDLKSGSEIGPDYARMLIRTASDLDGCVRMARVGTEIFGFGCAWIAEDDDALLRDDAREHGYVSDLFVEGAWRRQAWGWSCWKRWSLKCAPADAAGCAIARRPPISSH
jgi:hypothetical protein